MIKKNIFNDSFSKNSMYYISSSMVGQGLSFLFIPFFTRILSPYDYGVVAIYMSLISFFFIFYEMNVRRSIVRYYHEKKDDFNIFLFNASFFLLLSGFSLSVVVLYFNGYIANFFNVTNRLIVYVVISVLLSLIVELYLSLLNAEEKAKKYAIISYIRSFLYVGLSVIGVLIITEHKYLGRIYGNIIALLVISLYAFVEILRKIKIKIQKKHFIYIFLFSFPLMFHTFSSFLLTFFDRIIINQIVGTKEAGLYSFAYNIAMIMNVFIIGFNKAWVPFFYRKRESGKIEDIQKKSEIYSLYVSFLLLTVGLLSPNLAIFMASDKYIDGINLIPIMTIGIGFVFVYNLYANTSLYHKKTGYIVINSFIAVIVNLVLNYLLIPKFGYKIAAYTTVFSYIVLSLLHYFTSKYKIKDTIFNAKDIMTPFILSILIVLIFAIFDKHFLLNYIFIVKCSIIILFGYGVFRIVNGKRIKNEK